MSKIKDPTRAIRRTIKDLNTLKFRMKKIEGTLDEAKEKVEECLEVMDDALFVHNEQAKLISASDEVMNYSQKKRVEKILNMEEKCTNS